MDRTSRRRAGFSLIELMIAVSILVIVVAAVMQSFVVQNKAYTVTDQVIEAQQSLRAVAWLLERDARMTGFLVPEAAALCAIDEQDTPDRVWFTDADALDPDGQSRPALGAEVTGYGESVGPDSLTVDSLILDDDSGLGSNGFYDLDGDGDGDSDFVEGAGVILANVDDPAAGVACGVVSSISGTNTINVDFENAISVEEGARVILVPAHVYEVSTSGDEPQLLRDGRVIATGVEDLQVAFFFDIDRDGEIDNPGAANGEMPGEDGGDVYEADEYDNRDLREVRINLVTRTRMDDVDVENGQFQAKENRDPEAGNDGYRRRVHSSTVKLRNVGYRGTAT